MNKSGDLKSKEMKFENPDDNQADTIYLADALEHLIKHATVDEEKKKKAQAKERNSLA